MGLVHCQSNTPIQITFRGPGDKRGIRADTDGSWRKGEDIVFAPQASTTSDAASASPRTILELAEGEEVFRWSASEHNAHKWAQLSRDIEKAAIWKANDQSDGIVGTSQISVSSFNAGAHRGFIEPFRCGSFHVLIGQESAGYDDDATSKRLAEIEAEGFVPVLCGTEMVATLRHAYTGHEILHQHADAYYSMCVVKLIFAYPLAGHTSLVFGSFHVNNVHAKKSHVSCGILHQIITRSITHNADICGFDVNQASGMLETVLNMLGGGGTIIRPPTSQDCVGLLLPPGSRLARAELKMSVPRYYSFYKGDLQLSLRDTDSHYLVAVHFRSSKRLRSTTAKQNRQAKKKANRRAKKGGAVQDEAQGEEDEEVEIRTVRAPSSDGDESEDLDNPWMRREPPRPSQEAFEWAARVRRRRQVRTRPLAPRYTVEPFNPTEDDSTWPGWVYWPPPPEWRELLIEPHRRRQPLDVLGCLGD
jgi:hypothetical protein